MQFPELRESDQMRNSYVRQMEPRPKLRIRNGYRNSGQTAAIRKHQG
jgi:hypothetical protein